MIKTIDLDKLSKEEKDKVASDISGGSKKVVKAPEEKEESETWIVTPLALIKAEDIINIYVDAKREGLSGYHVYVTVKNIDGTKSYPIRLGICKNAQEAQDLLNGVYDQIKEVI